MEASATSTGEDEKKKKGEVKRNGGYNRWDRPDRDLAQLEERDIVLRQMQSTAA